MKKIEFTNNINEFIAKKLDIMLISCENEIVVTLSSNECFHITTIVLGYLKIFKEMHFNNEILMNQFNSIKKLFDNTCSYNMSIDQLEELHQNLKEIYSNYIELFTNGQEPTIIDNPVKKHAYALQRCVRKIGIFLSDKKERLH